MEVHQLSFVRINIINEHLAEVIVNEGVEMDMEMVNQYHQFLLTHLKSPFKLLINKLHTYSYTFNAQQNLATLPEIKAMAVVHYTDSSRIAQETLNNVPRTIQWNLESFSNRDKALDWLHGS